MHQKLHTCTDNMSNKKGQKNEQVPRDAAGGIACRASSIHPSCIRLVRTPTWERGAALACNHADANAAAPTHLLTTSAVRSLTVKIHLHVHNSRHENHPSLFQFHEQMPHAMHARHGGLQHSSWFSGGDRPTTSGQRRSHHSHTHVGHSTCTDTDSQEDTRRHHQAPTMQQFWCSNTQPASTKGSGP